MWESDVTKVVDQESAGAVQGFMGALNAGDLQAARGFLDEQVTWTVVGAGIPGGGEHRGADTVIAFIQRVRAQFAPGDPSLDIRNFAAVDGLVVIEAQGSGKLVDGRDYSNPYLITIDVADGQIKAIREYFDSHYVASLELAL